MSLAGLILTDDDGHAGQGTPSALLNIAGQPLIEYQARIARAAGAGHIVVVVDRLPTGLVEAFDRLRADGIAIDVARTPRDAADKVHPEERVILMSAGAIAPVRILAIQAKAAKPVVLAALASNETVHLERIDAEHRWAGIALLPGSALRATADMLGDWALAPTLLRAALQHGAKPELAPGVCVVRNAREARTASLALVGDDVSKGGFGQRHIVAPLSALALPWLSGGRTPFGTLAALPLLLLAVAALAGLLGWVASACVALLLGAVIAVSASRLAAVGGRSTGWLKWHDRLQPAAYSIIALSAGSVSYLANGEWGPLVLAAWASVALNLRPREAMLDSWMADTEASALVLLIAIVAGAPAVGLAVILAHAVVTQFVLVRGVT